MTAYASRNTVIKRGSDDSPTTFTTIPQVNNIVPPSASSDEIDVTNLESSAKEYVLDIVDYGQCTFDMFVDRNNAQHSGIKDDLDSGTVRGYQINHSDGTTENFEARVQGISPNAGVGSANTMSVTLRVTGPSVWS